MFMAHYKPRNLSLDQDVHMFTAKFNPDKAGYIVRGIDDRSDNHYLVTSKQSDMDKIQ